MFDCHQYIQSQGNMYFMVKDIELLYLVAGANVHRHRVGPNNEGCQKFDQPSRYACPPHIVPPNPIKSCRHAHFFRYHLNQFSSLKPALISYGHVSSIPLFPFSPHISSPTPAYSTLYIWLNTKPSRILLAYPSTLSCLFCFV